MHTLRVLVLFGSQKTAYGNVSNAKWLCGCICYVQACKHAQCLVANVWNFGIRVASLSHQIMAAIVSFTLSALR